MPASNMCMDNVTPHNKQAIDFENIVKEYSLLITKVCYYFATNISELKDLRQDVLLNIWTGWENFRMQSKPSTWIYRVCFNTCITYQRKNRQRKNEVPLSSVLESEDDTFDMEMYREMHRLINQLGAENKAIIMMWLDENSYEEIAEVIGLKRNTVATRIKRIKEKLVKLSNE